MTCPVAGSIPLTDGASVAAGNTYTLSGTSGFNNITMNGGTLVICGTLNLANFTFNSGTIYVAPGGMLNVNTGASLVFGSNSTIYNFGSVYFASSIVTGANNLLFNCTLTSFFNVPFNQVVVQGPNTYIVNNGTFNSSYFIVQSTNAANAVCSGAGSVISTGIMINQFPNAFNSPNGPSCIQITNTIINSQPMTASPSVNICYVAASVSVVQGPNFGSATVNSACPNCAVPLPVEIANTSANCFDSKIRLSWDVESETDCAVYTVQRSGDGVYFDDALEVQCHGAGASSYTAELPANYQLKEEYVRLKRSETNGTYTLSDPMTVSCDPGVMVNIYPTMITNEAITVNSDQRIISITMYAMDGKEVQRFPVDGQQKEVSIRLGDNTAVGQYLLTVTTEHTRVDKLLRVVR